MRVWIDLTNTAHVVVLRPLVERLEAAGHEVEITARPLSHTLDLLDDWGHPYTLGRVRGRGQAGKARAAADRVVRMLAFGRGKGFDAALAHGSTDLPVACRVLRIPNATMFDYEFAVIQHNVNCRLANRVLVPEAIPAERLRATARRAQARALPGAEGGVLPRRLRAGPGLPARLGVSPGCCSRSCGPRPPTRCTSAARRTRCCRGCWGGSTRGRARRSSSPRTPEQARRRRRARPRAPRDRPSARSTGAACRARRRARVGRRHDEPRGRRARHAGLVDVRGAARRRRRAARAPGPPEAAARPRGHRRDPQGPHRRPHPGATRASCWRSPSRGSDEQLRALRQPRLPHRRRADGLRPWAATYEDTVQDAMDVELLDALTELDVSGATVADLGCGSGRTGAWLPAHGAAAIDGVDVTPEMLEVARARGVFRVLRRGDVGDTGLPGGAYDSWSTSPRRRAPRRPAPALRRGGAAAAPGRDVRARRLPPALHHGLGHADPLRRRGSASRWRS